jgi:hypothetical protein
MQMAVIGITRRIFAPACIALLSGASVAGQFHEDPLRSAVTSKVKDGAI